MTNDRINWCKWKLGLSVRNARRFSRHSWQDAETKRQAREFREEARDAMRNARYWRDMLNNAQEAL